MTNEEVAAAIASDRRLIVVEAGAGTGKTHVAAAAAAQEARCLSGGREVLLLAHTHAAIDEFKARLGTIPGVRYETLDSFALSLLRAHPCASGLPLPLRPDYARAGEWFASLTRAAHELLFRAPALAHQVALHHPMIIFDEHQDARTSQHAIALRLRDAGARIRILGDPLQAIYEFGEEPAIGWSEVCHEADAVLQLVTPHRWSANVELGTWLVEAREALARGERLPMKTAPASVRTLRMNSVGDASFRTTYVAPGLGAALRGVLPTLKGSVAVLVPYNKNVFGVRSATSRRFAVHEGHDLKVAHAAVQDASVAGGDGETMVGVALSLASKTCTGVTKKVRQDAADCCKGGVVNLGRRRSAPPLVDLLLKVLEDPTLGGLALFARELRARPPVGIVPDLTETLDAVARLASPVPNEPHEAIVDYIRRRRAAAGPLGVAVMTVHKAKGRAFDHVVLVHCSSGPFALDERGSRLLYVALTRARQTIQLLVSDSHPSPLLSEAHMASSAPGPT